MSRPPLKPRDMAKNVGRELDIELPPPVHAGGRGTFYKGQKRSPNAGRKKGTPNKNSAILKECILEAAARIGSDGKGTDGLLGYLVTLALHFPKTYAHMLTRVLPYQVNVQADHEHRVLRSREEIEDEMRRRGLPLPQLEILN